ncbi:hypothetical protein [Sulfurimonas sp.]|jgi:hypothetical protein|uniref:hypothetical protein n=1 Tax=Sulfurimonas sp. TaxID=2022749 RepID=UPI0025D45CD8|nr:hypothetical protein [Sulfurimonas sp.]MBT5934776.1 hypothetical protein [Sulfurimonas sp.]
MSGIEVYPFSPSKKLYQVNNEWVKARCSGFKVETTWVGQDTVTQIVKLSHTDATLPHEYIAPISCDDDYIFNTTNYACELIPLPMPSAWFYSTAVYGSSSLGCWKENFMLLYGADSKHFKSSWEVISGGATLTFSQQPVSNCTSSGVPTYAGIYWVAVADGYTTDPDRYALIRHTVTSADGRVTTHVGSIRTSPIPY